VIPVARSFEPDLVAISAGYDAHRADPLSTCRLDADAFGDMTSSMRDLARDIGAPLLICLEGGYDVDALAASVIATLQALESRNQARVAPVEPAAPYIERLRPDWPDL
jgi:acetoin utilization deacetylase AcuC-like enzyme